MYKYFIAILLVAGLTTTGCKKFVNLDPPNNLSGNNFWQNAEDVEAFTNGMYQQLRQCFTRPNLQAGSGTAEFPFFLFTGDLRGAPVIRNTAWGRTYIDYLAVNDVKTIFDKTKFNSDGNDWYGIWNMPRFSVWDNYYKVIASANIQYAKVDEIKNISNQEKAKYKAEAVFIRSFAYFMMVRLWGDIPYYTKAYQTESLPRTKMVEVLKNCLADLQPVYENLPWTYDDPVYVGVRGMRGSALALMMHINMWLAGFDTDNNAKYYEDVTKLGDELVTKNGGAYALLPIEKTGEIFKGRSKEALFEIPQNKRYNESFGWGTYFDHVNPQGELNSFNQSGSYPYIFYTIKFMEDLWPQASSDKDLRKTLWYRASTMYTQKADFRMYKFLLSIDESNPDFGSFDASAVVFRYSDAILLYAEALAELGKDGDAINITQIVRNRAEAPPLTTAGDELKNDIYLERGRELMGEGHWWYDLVRTKRILKNPYGYTASLSQFLAGCWTWPIDKAALKNNPYMTLNNYWL